MVGDDAFQLKSYLLKPYSFKSTLTMEEEEHYNERQSRARRVVENAFGHLNSRLGVLGKAIQLRPDQAEKIVMAAVLLHNFLIEEKDNCYAEPNLTCVNDQQMTSIENQLSGALNIDANDVRTEVMHYVNNKGRLA